MVTPTTTTGLRARKKAQLREAIEREGLRLFATHGFDGTTVDAIAEACNVSATTVFRYFPTKEDIVFASAARDGDKLVELLAQQPEDLKPAPALYRALRALCDEYAGNKARVAKNQRMVENSNSLRARKAEFQQRYGYSLTYLPFVIAATVEAIHEYPILNASIEGPNIIYHNEINIGIAVALENGLIVPVIRNADERNVTGLQRAIVDLSTRARNQWLTPLLKVSTPCAHGGSKAKLLLMQRSRVRRQALRVAVVHEGNDALNAFHFDEVRPLFDERRGVRR